MPRRPNLLWLAPLLVGIGALLQWWQRDEVPTRDDWKAAADHVRAELKPGDGVAWLPYWAGEGRLFLHDLPIFHLVEETPDFGRYDRVWLLGAFGHRGADFAEPLQSHEFGRVTVDLIAPKEPKVVADAYATLDQLKVTRVKRGKPKACDFWDGRGWHCRLRKSPDATRKCLGQPIAKRRSRERAKVRHRRHDTRCGLDIWLHVSRDHRVVGDEVRRCIWFHPSKDFALNLEWPDAPAGELVLDHGFADPSQTIPNPRTVPATLRVFQGEAELSSVKVEPRAGWKRLRVPVAKAGTLRIEATTTSTAEAHLCIDPTIRSLSHRPGSTRRPR